MPMDELIDYTVNFVRGENRASGIERTHLLTQLSALSRSPGWPNGTTDDWNDAIAFACESGALRLSETHRIVYVVKDEAVSPSDDQGMLF